MIKHEEEDALRCTKKENIRKQRFGSRQTDIYKSNPVELLQNSV